MNFIELLNQNQIQDHEFLELFHNHIHPTIRDLLFDIIHYLFFLNSSDYLSIKTTGNAHKTTFTKSIILSSYSSFVLASEYQPQSQKVKSFLTMFISKENKNFVFPNSSQKNLNVEPNRFKNTVIKMNYSNDMFGIRVFNWYHEFYALLHYYLYEIYLYDDYKPPYVNLSLMLHLTGSPGIGKSTFIYYFVLRWSQMIDLDSSKFYHGINIYFKDSTKFEKVLILKFDDTIYLMKYKSMDKLKYNITIRYYEIYCINNFEVISITDNYKNNHCSEIEVEIRQSTLTFTISSPNCQEINFFDVFDGNQTQHYFITLGKVFFAPLTTPLKSVRKVPQLLLHQYLMSKNFSSLFYCKMLKIRLY
ncbi:hypothetical protein TRFO_18677 [Tritrichomonas foetus]|uniref:Uncharacterized protein n=1 Tax=Tritrichomonas foetus TaxID=1144522 RepID=A0A1J4KQ06_9EUKA|nr:hypothetical protein TRFO_18677 [Tritrichomonas foetus]|eukprot:OHT11782.1 hypothetical protein TRFO_18677 [Tritrichomonas foetus]